MSFSDKIYEIVKILISIYDESKLKIVQSVFFGKNFYMYF